MRSELINKLENILNNSKEASIYTYEELYSTITVNEKATPEEIENVNSYFGYRVPLNYISFLKIFNGCTLFKVEDIGGFKFFSCDEMVKNNKFQKENLSDDWNDDIVLFCSCLGDGDFMGFEIENAQSYEVIDCFHEVLPVEWKSIGLSFDDFLEKLIDLRGEKFWLK